MDAPYYLVLIEVHFRKAVFFKGQRLTMAEMGLYAHTLICYSIALPEAQVPAGRL